MTLGSLWRLLERGTRCWLAGGTVAVLAGVAIGLSSTFGTGAGGFPDAGPGGASMELLLPSLFLSLGGGYAVLFPGLRAGGDVRLLRDWKVSPLCSRLLCALALATAAAGLMACILAAATHASHQAALVWLFMGPFLALSGWTAGLMGTGAAVRSAGAPEGHAALTAQPL